MATHAIRTVSLDEVLTEPRYFPIHVDFSRDRLVLVETGRSRLRRFLSSMEDFRWRTVRQPKFG